jgi:hypothetical protein
MDHGQELFRTAPDLKLQDAFTRPLEPVLSDSMRREARCCLTNDYLKLGTNIVLQIYCVIVEAFTGSILCMRPSQIRSGLIILCRLDHGRMLKRLLISVRSFKSSTINFGKMNTSFVG